MFRLDLNVNKIFVLISISFIIFLGFLFLLFIKNLNHHVLKKREHFKLIIFWEHKDLKRIKGEWRKIKSLKSVLYIKSYLPDEALKILIKNSSELKAIKGLLKKNPIPPTAIVVFKDTNDLSLVQFKKDLKLISSLKGVQVLNLFKANLNLLEKWKDLEKVLFSFLIILTFLITFIISNSFRINLLMKREEIEILWLIGATRFYIIFPEILKTFLFVVFSSGISLGLIFCFYGFLNSFLNTPPFWFEVQFLDLKEIIFYISFLLIASLIIIFAYGIVHFHKNIKGDSHEE